MSVNEEVLLHDARAVTAENLLEIRNCIDTKDMNKGMTWVENCKGVYKKLEDNVNKRKGFKKEAAMKEKDAKIMTSIKQVISDAEKEVEEIKKLGQEFQHKLTLDDKRATKKTEML